MITSRKHPFEGYMFDITNSPKEIALKDERIVLLRIDKCLLDISLKCAKRFSK